jgi:hypothetical protein
VQSYTPGKQIVASCCCMRLHGSATAAAGSAAVEQQPFRGVGKHGATLQHGAAKFDLLLGPVGHVVFAHCPVCP